MEDTTPVEENPVDSAPVLSRSERRKLAEQESPSSSVPKVQSVSFTMGKKAMAIAGVTAVAGMVLTGILSYKAGQVNDDARFTSTVSSSLHFDEQSFPEGWDDKISERDKGTQFSDRNPLPASFEGCSYTRMTTFLPASKVGKGGEYLSKSLAYEYAESLGELDPATSVQKIHVDGKKTGAFKAEWDKRIVMVRAFDSFEPQKAPDDMKEAPPQGIATVTDEGVPAVILEYSCGEKGSFDPELAESMFDATNIIS